MEAESPITSTSGCAAVTMSTDTGGVTYTCEATSAGGTVSASVTVKRDATDPVIAFAGNAYTFGVGTTTLNASALDVAGNSSALSTSCTASVTSGSLGTLVRRWVSQRRVATSLCQQLNNRAYGAFIDHVRSQSGNSVPADKAAILIALAQQL